MSWARWGRRTACANSVLLAGLLAIGAWVPAPARSAISGAIVVNTAADTVSPTDGLCSLREAITAANSNATSGVVAGECPPGTTGLDPINFEALASPIVLASNLPAIVSDVRIDGTAAGAPIIVDGAGAWRPFTASSGTVTLRQLAIQHGHAAAGAGAVSSSTSLTLEHVTITDSSGATGGGVLASGTLSIDDVVIAACVATTAGGGLYLASPAVATIAGLVASGNTAPTGGAITVAAGAAIAGMSASTFTGNSATANGGAIESDGSVTMGTTTFANNTAENGGAINLLDPGTLAVSDSLFDGNTAVGTGGAISATGAVYSTRSTYVDNSAGTSGGAVWSSYILVFSQGTFYGNVAPEGGAIRNPETALVAVTVVGNTTTGPSSAAVHLDPGGAEIFNALVVGNTGGDIITNSWHTANNLLAIPAGRTISDIVVPGGPRDNGGPTLTIGLTPNTKTNPAVDAGGNDTCKGSIGAIDQRGRPRPVNACDIGAFELDRVPPTVTAPVVNITTGGTLQGARAPIRVTWTGADNPGGTGIGKWLLWRSLNGGAYAALGGTLSSPALATSLASGSTARFRSRAANGDGTLSTVATGPAIQAALVQQTSSSLHWAGTWSTGRSSAYSGGSARYATRAGASVSYTFTGRNIALVTTRAATRGSIRVYINGTLRATVDLGGASAHGFVAWQARFSTSATRTIKVVVVGTKGRPRVDIDGFVVLR
jgi:CSLREA domain-containing protein